MRTDWLYAQKWLYTQKVALCMKTGYMHESAHIARMRPTSCKETGIKTFAKLAICALKWICILVVVCMLG
jgi:hypothetical protein